MVLTLDLTTGGAYVGTNHLDLAVSDTSDPTGSWTIYVIDVTDNGTNGTPDHGCGGGYCLGDYPHIGADAYGLFLTTNEYPFFANGYHGTQVYALSKRQLAAGGAVTLVRIDTADDAYLFEDHPGFTVWPAVSGQGEKVAAKNGTEYFLSDLASWTDEGIDSRVQLWSMSGTKSLDSASPKVNLTYKIVNTLPYAEPPNVAQKPGDYPLGQFLGDPLPRLDANDTRMQQVYYGNGKVWAANGTGIVFDGDPEIYAGVVYYVINPNSGKTQANGYIAVPGNNLTYPAAAAGKDGRGIVAFTLVGEDFYPSAAYASLDAVAGAGEVQIAGAGVGPWDGFTGYPQYHTRSRWGDYGAAVVDGNSFWIASEYIAQTCTLAQWIADSTCGGTRGQLSNWSTHLGKLQIK